MTSAPRWAVSVKGVLVCDEAVVLLRNEREEWELPGGRLEQGETPEQCVVREIAEETGVHVRADRLLDAWVYEPVPDRSVLILTFGCSIRTQEPLRVSAEHSEARWVPVCGLDQLVLPKGYRDSIDRWVHATATHGESI